MVIRRSSGQTRQSVAAQVRLPNPDPGADATPLDIRLEQLPAAERTRLGAAGFRTFLGIADLWSLAVSERRLLLGDIADSTYHNWKANRFSEPSRDLLERLSLLLGIYKALRLIFTDESTSIRWLRGENTDPTFACRSPLSRMLDGSIDDLYDGLADASAAYGVRSLQEWHKDGNASREISGGTEPGGPADLKPSPDARAATRPVPPLASREATT